MSKVKNIIDNSFEQKMIQEDILQRIGGGLAYTAKGKKVKNDIENRFREILNLHNCHEVELPLIIDYNQINMDPIIKRGRLAQCFEIETEIETEKKCYLAHTSEELAATYLSDRDDAIIYQIRSKFRNEPEVNIFKKLEFTMLEVYSYSQDNKVYRAVRKMLLDTLEEFVKPIRINILDGNDTGIISEEIYYDIYGTDGVEIGHFYMMGNTYKQTLGKDGFFASYGIGIDRLLLCSILS